MGDFLLTSLLLNGLWPLATGNWSWLIAAKIAQIRLNPTIYQC